MRKSYRRRSVSLSIWILAAAGIPAGAHGLHAQVSQTSQPSPPSPDQREILLLEATPIGALPPIPLPMPASRNQSYFGLRLQYGDREDPNEAHLTALAAGLDLQYRGGSVIGITGGYQKRDCIALGANCGGHTMFGIRSRLNVLTGGQTIGQLFKDYSSTTTLGGEWGLGYSPDVLPGVASCTLDFGMPVTISLGQRVRVASFLTPGVMWDMGCRNAGTPSRRVYLLGFGFGLQQLQSRGLYLYLGLQKIFRKSAGYQVGLSITYVRLP